MYLQKVQIGHDRTFFHSHLGKGQFTCVGSFHTDPNDVNAPYSGTQWNDEGDMETFRQYYKVSQNVKSRDISDIPNARTGQIQSEP